LNEACVRHSGSVGAGLTCSVDREGGSTVRIRSVHSKQSQIIQTSGQIRQAKWPGRIPRIRREPVIQQGVNARTAERGVGRNSQLNAAIGSAIVANPGRVRIGNRRIGETGWNRKPIPVCAGAQNASAGICHIIRPIKVVIDDPLRSCRRPAQAGGNREECESPGFDLVAECFPHHGAAEPTDLRECFFHRAIWFGCLGSLAVRFVVAGKTTKTSGFVRSKYCCRGYGCSQSFG
jgi:hypothetical protein